MTKLDILYVGRPDGTAAQRAEALRSLGHSVRHVPTGPPRSALGRLGFRLWNRLRGEPDGARANPRVLRELASAPADLLWIDKGLAIRPRTIRAARRIRRGLVVVAYSPDDMLHPSYDQPRYRATVPLYDLHVTTKSFNVPELRAIGARDVFFVDKSFDPATHRPLELTPADLERYGAAVGFVGAFEEERASDMTRLASAGIEVTVWGDGWGRLRPRVDGLRVHGRGLPGVEYAKAINATRINLGFLRKAARDRQTARSVEIPACGAFMLAERTDEHLRLFEEGREAEYFGDFDELLAKCRYYLEHDDQRRRIAAAARRRCVESRYSHADRLREVLDYLAPRFGSTGAQ